jgi:hypothetical protein
MVARSAQLAREAFRSEARLGNEHPRAQKLALLSARHAARLARIDDEFAAAQVATPAATPDATVIWGRVSEDRKPKPNVIVSARGPKGEVEGFGCTDAAGGFSMTVPGQGAVTVRVTDAKNAVLYAGTEQLQTPPGAVYYRDIRIGEAPVDICRRPPDDAGNSNEPDKVRVPDIVGRGEAEGVRLLTAVGLKPGERREVQSAEPAGGILRQSPEANTEAPRGSAVTIEVGARSDHPVPRLVGVEIAQAQAALARAGLDVADMTVRVDPQHSGIILEQDPLPDTPVEAGRGVTLTIGITAKPVPAKEVLQLLVFDPRFRQVRLSEEELQTRLERPGVLDRADLAALASTEDNKLRDSLRLQARRDAQVFKRLLRDMLAKTE